MILLWSISLSLSLCHHIEAYFFPEYVWEPSNRPICINHEKLCLPLYSTFIIQDEKEKMFTSLCWTCCIRKMTHIERKKLNAKQLFQPIFVCSCSYVIRVSAAHVYSLPAQRHQHVCFSWKTNWNRTNVLRQKIKPNICETFEWFESNRYRL